MGITRGETYEERFGPERAEQEKRKRGKGKTYEEMYGPEKAAQLTQLRAEHFHLQRDQFMSMAKERWETDKEYRQKMIRRAHETKPSEEAQARLNVMSSERFCKLWKDPEYVLKQLKARGASPNKLEQHFNDILNSHFPEYQYNGDGRLGIVLSGLVPDFVNVNGKKQIIEVFGDYWHEIRRPKWHQTELGRIMAYKSVGWECLVIWEHEIKELTEKQILDKIRQFHEGG